MKRNIRRNRSTRHGSRRLSPYFIRRLSSWLVLSTALTLGSAETAKAAPIYWDSDQLGVNNILTGGGLGGLGTWNTTQNLFWSGLPGLADQLWANGTDTAVFTGTAGTVTLGTAVSVGGLQFNTTGYVLGITGTANANTITMAAATDNIVLNNIAAATINAGFAGTGNVVLGGGVFNGNTLGTLTLSGTGTTGAALGGWSGTTTINNGMTMALSQSSAALSSTSGITLNGGGITITDVANTTTASAGTTASTTVTVASAANIAIGQVLVGAAAGVTGSPTVTAINGTTITLSSAQTITNGGTLTFTDAPITRINSGATITSNGGTFTVTNPVNTNMGYTLTTGPVALTSGRLNIVSTAANTGGTQLLTIGTTGSSNLTQAGTSTVGFSIAGGGGIGIATNQINVFGQASNAANTIIGPWATVGTAANAQSDYAVYNINAGTVNALGIQAAGIAGVANDTTFTTVTASTSNYTVTASYTASGTVHNINSLRYLGAAGTVTMTGAQTIGTLGVLNASSSTGTFTIGNTAGTGTLTLPTTSPDKLYLTTGGGFGITVNANINDNTAPGVLTLVISGSNIVTLAGTTSTYSGGTVINGGTLTVAGTAQLGAVTGGVTFNSSGTLSITGATQTLASGRTFNINNGALATLNTTSATVTTIAGIVQGTGGIIATPIVAGTLTLSGLNTYSGPTFVNTGSLKAGVATTGANGAFGNNSAVTLANVAGVFLDITGFNNTIGSLSGGGTTGGSVILGSATLTVGGNNENTTFLGTVINASGASGGAGVLTKTGTGILTLPTSTRTATTTALSSASTTLTVPTGGFGPGMAVSGTNIPAGTTVVSITSGTALVLSNAVTVANGAVISFGGNGYSGGTNLNNGLVNIANVAALGSGALTFNGGGLQWSPNNTIFADAAVDPSSRTMTFSASGATFDTNGNEIFFANAVGNSGTGGLTKNGLGTLFLQGSNLYSGATVVNAGVLNLQNAGALGTGGAGVTVNTGATLALQHATGANFGSKPLTLNGTGSLFGQNGALVNVGGNNTYGGTITLGSSATISSDNAGDLQLASTGSITGTGFGLTLGGAGTGTLKGSIQTGVGGSLTKTGTGTWTVSGVAGNYDGGTTINGGKLIVDLTTNPAGVLSATSALNINGSDLTINGPGNQTVASLNLGAGVNTNIAIIPNGGATTLTITGPGWTRGAGAAALFDYSSLTTGTRTATVTNIPTGTGGATGTNNILGYADVKDSGGITGLAYVDGSNNISRFDSTTAAVLADNSNSATTDYTTLGMASNPLLWSNGITTRSVNSLTFDTSGGNQTVHMGAVGNVLTISSGALQKINANDATLLGGQIGANNSEVIVHQNGTGTLFLNSPISSGTGALTKLGSGTLQVSGGLSTATGTLNGTTTVTVADTSGLAVGQAVTGGGIPANTTIASIVDGNTITLSTAATASMTSPLTFGTGSTYTGATIIDGGTVKAGASSQFATAAAGTTNNAGYVTSTGGPLGIGSAVTLANVSGAALDVNGFNVAIGSLSGGFVSPTVSSLLLSNGGTLTVGGGNLINNISTAGQTTTFGGLISGTGNLTITGGGGLQLTNSSNSFSGQVNVNSGTLVVSGNLLANTNSVLGNSNSLIAVNGISSTQGLPGGTLLIQGGLGATGITVSRSISISGRGNNTVGGSLINIGNNTYTGIIDTSNSSETRVGSIAGTWTLGNAGSLYLGAAGTTFFTTIGAGNIVLNGVVSGGAASTVGLYMAQSGVINKTMVLNNYSNNFIGEVRLDGGTIRVSNGGALGVGTSANSIRGNVSSAWEIRTDSPTSFSTRNVSSADGAMNTFVDRAVGGAGLGTVSFSAAGLPTYGATGSVTFGNFTKTAGNTPTLTGRDGYGAVFNSAGGTFGGAGANSNTYTNSSNGLFTLNGSMATGDGTSRAVTINGNADTLFNGFLINSGGVSNLGKSGQGTLVMNGSNTVAVTTSNNLGGVQVTGGTLLITQAGGGTATIAKVIGTGAGAALSLSGGALDYRGPGETVSGNLMLNVNGTGNAIVLANNSSGSLLFQTPFGAGNTGTKFLGGSSTTAEYAAVINGTAGVTKIGTGTWLYDPATTSFAVQPTGYTVASGGGQNANTFVVGSGTNTIAVGMAVSGGNVPGSSIVTAVSGTTITISNSIGTALTAGTVLTFTANASFTGALTVTGGIMQVKPTAATGNGSNLFATSNNLVFNVDSITNNGSAGGTFELATPTFGNLTADLAQTMGLLQVSAGAGKVQVDSGNNAFSNIVKFNGYTTHAAGGTVNFAPAASLAGIQFAVAPTAVLNGVLTGAYITNPSTGAIDFVATPSINTNIAALGSTTTLPVTGGTNTVNYSLSTAAASPATTTTTGAVVANTLRIADGKNLALGNSLTITSTGANNEGGILHDNTNGASTISGAQNIVPNTASTELLIITGGNATNVNPLLTTNTLTISSVLSNSTTTPVTKAGSGTLVLSGQNTFQGALTINEGVLRASGGNTQTLGAPAAGTVDILRQGAFLDVNAAGASVSQYTGHTAIPTLIAAPILGAGSITTTAAGNQAIQFGTSASSATTGVFSGVISDGSGSMTVVRNGTTTSVQALTGLNTYTGPTIITGGILQANVLANGGVASSIGQSSNAASNLVLNGGVLLYQGSNANVYQTTQTPSISIDRLFTVAANSTIDSSGTYGNNIFGTATANQAALVFNGTAGTGGVTGTDAVALSGAVALKTLTLQGSSTGDNAINLRLADSGGITLGVTKTNAGHWVLGNVNNTYSGPTTITQGQLVAQDAGSNATSATTLAGGTSTTDFSVTSTKGLTVGQAVTGAGISGSPFIAAVLDETHIRLSTSQTLAGSTALTFGSINSLSSSNLAFNQGTAGTEAVLESVGTFTRSVGTGANQVQWSTANANGGFAASSSPLTVTFGGSASFGVGGIGNGIGQLYLNSTTALSDVTISGNLNLNGAVRTINVFDNTTTNTDFATISGVISGGTGSGLTKLGTGVLYLTGANTYSGNTTLGIGTTIVTSIGGGSTTASAFGDGSGILSIGSGTAAANLIYAGPGETSSRQINLTSSSGQGTNIDASGSGALVLSNVVNASAAIKVLTLRGFSNDANTISSNLTDNGGALLIAKTDGGTWVLSGNNSFTGGVRVDSGFLGITSGSSLGAVGPAGLTTNAVAGSTTITLATGTTANLSPGMLFNSNGATYGDTITSIVNATTFVVSRTITVAAGSPVAAGGLSMSNGAIFATASGGFTTSQPVVISSNTGGIFTGSNQITLNGTVYGDDGNPWSLVNTINTAGGGSLTVNGNIVSLESGTARDFTIAGTGNTFLNGTFASAGASIVPNFNTSGTVTLGGAGTDPTAQHQSTRWTEGRVINTRAASTNPLGSNLGVVAVNGGSLETTVSLAGANALPMALRLDNNYFVLAGGQPIEFTGNATQAFGLQLAGTTNQSRTLTNNITSGGLTISGSQGVQLSNDATSRTLVLAGSGIYTISTPISNGGGSSAGALTYSGTGALNITATNVYGGNTAYNGGVTTISGSAGNVSNVNATATITVANSATLTLDNTTAFAGNRLNNKPITLTGATLNFIGNAAGSTEGTAANATSTLTVGSGQTTINITNNSGTTQLNLASLTTSTGGYTNFTSNVQLGTATNQVIFTTAPALSPVTIGVLNRATVSGTAVAGGLSTAAPEFATYNTNGLTANTNGIQAFTAYNVPTLSSTTVAGTNTTVTVASTAGLSNGMAIFGPTVSVGATIGTILSPTTYTITGTITTGGTQALTYGTTGYTSINSPLVLASTDTIKLGASFIPTTADDINANRTFNAINIAGSGIDLSSTGGNATLTITGGGVIVSGGSNTMSVDRVALGAEGAFHIDTGASLNLTGSLTGTAGLNKNLAGSLTLSNKQFYTGTTTLNAGTTTLGGGTNTLFFGNTLSVNNGATLDLNGNTQYAGSFTSAGGVVLGAGGTVTSGTGTGNLITNAANGTWAGSITDAAAAVTNFSRLGANTLTMVSGNTYKGATAILGGQITLRDNGTLANTSAITVNYGTLAIDNNAGLLIDNTNRINDGAPISISGGTISYNSRPNSNGSETLGALTAAQGANTLTSGVQGLGSYQTGDLAFASLARSAGTTINFTSGGGTLGSEGSNPRILFTAAPANNSSTNALGAWAIVQSGDYAAYNVAQGVGAMGTSGYTGYSAGLLQNATVTGTTLTGGTLIGFGAGLVTNVLTAQDQFLTLPAGGASTGMLRLTSSAAGVGNHILFASNTDKLNLINGGLLHNNISAGSLIGNQTTPGILTAGPGTAGTTELVIYNANTTTASGTLTAAAVTNVTSIPLTAPSATITAGMMVSGAGVTPGTYVTSVSGATIGLSTGNTLAASTALTFTPAFVVNSSIQDVGGGSLTSLVKSGAGQLTLTNANTFSGTGGTVVDQGTLNLASLGTGGIFGTVSVTANTANALTVASTAGLTVGQLITGTGMTSSQGWFVQSITSGTVFNVANNTATAALANSAAIGQQTLLNVGSATNVVIPGDLTINGGVTGTGATVTMLLNAGQIASTSNVTLNGRATLNLAGTAGLNTTLNSVAFNNNGGEAAPTVSIPTGSTLLLSSGSPISAASSNANNTAIIAPSAAPAFLALASGTNTINVGAIQLNGVSYAPLVPTLTISAIVNGASAPGSVSVTASSTTSATVTVASVPGSLVVGSTLLGQSVTAISGTSITLGGNASQTIASATSVPYLGSLAAGITKSGNGLLQLSGANTFTGGLTTTGTSGGVILAADTNITTLVSAGLGANTTAFINGPVGTGTLTLASGNSLLTNDTARNIVNSVVFQGNPIFDNTATGTTRIITLAGSVALPTGAVSISIPNPTVTAAITGAVNYTGVTSLSKTGLGNLNINLTGLSASAPISITGGGTLALLTDGNGDVTPQTTLTNAITYDAAAPSITVDRAGQTLLFNQALNKIIAPTTFTAHFENGLALTNNNQYGLVIADAKALNANIGATGPIYSVSAASPSDIVQGLTLNGQITGGAQGASTLVLTKAGAGALVLGNNTNTFGGTNAFIDITGGILQVSDNGALGASGASGNVVRISTNSATAGLRFAGGTSYTLTGRKIQLGNNPAAATASGIDVTTGTVATLDTAFTFVNAASTLAKNDDGVLAISANNSTWTGQLTINAGAVRAVGPNTNTLGSGATQILIPNGGAAATAFGGAALQLAGGVTVTNPININSSTGATSPNVLIGGINWGGQLSNFSGTNTYNGAITTNGDAAIGAESGTLNVTGGISMATATGRAFSINAKGSSIININTTALTNGAAPSWFRRGIL